MNWRPIHALVLVGLTTIAMFVLGFRFWPMFWVVPLAGYAAVVVIVRPLRSSFRPWCFGRISLATIAAAATIAVGSSVMLVGFQVLVQPDLRSFANVLPISALGGVLTTGVLFSIFNALFEEVIFRGILFDAIDSQWGASVAVVATSLLFGYGHMHGYPPGPLGAVLAGIYGLCLGWLRLFSGGLGLPVLAHIAADATIFTVVARSGVL